MPFGMLNGELPAMDLFLLNPISQSDKIVLPREKVGKKGENFE